MRLSYDDEAERYDLTRGGEERARTAAAAVAELAPGTGTAVDVAGGTGSISAELARLGWSVLVSDASLGMLGVARRRLPGRVFRATATRLPVRPASVDLVTTIWLLHLLSVAEADRVLAEVARVLRPGGVYVTTVDKDLAHGRVRRTNGDHRERVELAGRRIGLAATGSTVFDGQTQWASGPGGQRFPVAAFRRL